ncbi:MAG: hypothetical protein DU429_06905 [Candidatus Tokpelaia sp.]|nr:MAG: hypothetical protein DU429_06905 [Candidatus Tokpelaia sp.]KAA6206186.1 MAG: hypothetical protein DU430_02220 [Candidatus Tokpelaia sp.]
MDLINAFILPICVIVTAAVCAFFYRQGKELYDKTQKRITDLELRLHKRELVARLGGLIENHPNNKEFFSAYDYLWQRNQGKSAGDFIANIDAIIAEAQRTAKPDDNNPTESIIAAAARQGYKPQFSEAAKAANARLFEGQKPFPAQ